jgi:endonuclease/exonuclease/phosphatase family metal-dependent hydrolase
VLLGVGCAARPAVRAQLTSPIERTVRSDSSSPLATSLTLATYNVHGLLKRDAIRRDLARLDAVTVWCLQEFPYAADGDVESILPPGRWYVATIPLNRERPNARDWESQVIASRYPIEGAQVWPLDDGGAKRRVALTASIRANGRTVRIVNTDHEPSIFAWRDGNRVQVRRLVERLRACDDETVLVAGDFNCSGNVFRLLGNSGHARRIDAAMRDAGFTSVGAGGTTFRSGVIHAHLDRIYARQVYQSAGAIAATATGSDHLPVWIRFGMPPVVADRMISGASLAQ